MTSKEDFKKLRDLFYSEFLDENFDDVGVWNNIEKDLEQIELLKLELELEKTKVKYVMKQLKKQDKMLEAIKDLLNDGVLWLEIEHEMVESEEHKKKKQLIKEWLNED